MDLKGPWSLGKARWRDRVIWDGRVRGFGRGGRVWRRPQKVNLGRKCVEVEGEGKSHVKVACGLGRPFGGTVAVCQSNPLKSKIHAE